MIKDRITNAVEFANKFNLGDDYKEFANNHPSFLDFWQHCERSDWMLALLDASGYGNGDDLWEFLRRIQELSKYRFKHNQPTKNEIDQWRKYFYDAVNKFKDKLQEQVKDGYTTNLSIKPKKAIKPVKAWAITHLRDGVLCSDYSSKLHIYYRKGEAEIFQRKYDVNEKVIPVLIIPLK